MSDVCIALMTAPSMEVAQRIVSSAVENGLAACGNIVPQVISVYRWQGAMHTDAEVLVIFKTTRALFAKLGEHVTTLHPYDVPELIQIDVPDGTSSYLQWVRESVMG